MSMVMLGTVACQVTGATQQPALNASIEALVDRTRVDEPFRIRFEVRNPGDATVRLLLWNTPLESALSADLFEIVHDGARLAYRGRLVKRRLPPGPGDVMTLAPGAFARHEIDLSHVYDMDTPGVYSVRFLPAGVQTDDGKADGSEPAFATLRASTERLRIERY